MAIPTLPSSDLDATSSFYGRLGFEEVGRHHDYLIVCRGELELRDLHDWLVERLPRYMVPRYLERRETLPKTPSAKIEKYKLAAEPLDRDAVAEFVPARRSS
jgi:catechol 2,3-dioxygenase-like lactoylglutathione lyase family enzyme